QTSKNISAFLDEYKLLGGERSVVIENMNCKSFSDALLWKEQMRKIIEKYSNNPTDVPSLIIVLGQEAWSAYLSQPKGLVTKIPVICGMVSRNTVILPEDNVYLPDWEPKSVDAFDDLKDCNIVAGYSYDYDVDKNIQLIQDFYPKTKHIAFISDNSYGGVTMQALVKKKMKKHADLDLILLDGRKHTIYTVSDEISHLPENTSILLGTWRVDKNDGYFMRNATYAMEAANPTIPTFTLASIGLGHWALGGYTPCYREIGKDIANQVVNYFKNGKSKVNLKFIANQYSFDIKKLEEKGFKGKILPSGSVFVNEDIPFWKEYKYLIYSIIVAFFLLLAVLLITLLFLMRTSKLKDSLLIS
ncbi:MAG: two-component sensor histidine kinase, partial [Bacteroides sp.]